MSELLGKECSCINHKAKESIQWALDNLLGTLRRDHRDMESLLVEAKGEFEEILGRSPGIYGAEAKLQLLKDEMDFFLKLRKEIVTLPSCDEK